MTTSKNGSKTLGAAPIDMSPSTIIRLAILAALLGASASCDDPPYDPESLRGRWEIAKDMSEQPAKDDAFATVAADAAKALDKDVAMDAVFGIVDPTRREQVAAETALTFARAGEHAEAFEVTKLMNEGPERERVREELAELKN